MSEGRRNTAVPEQWNGGSLDHGQHQQDHDQRSRWIVVVAITYCVLGGERDLHAGAFPGPCSLQQLKARLAIAPSTAVPVFRLWSPLVASGRKTPDATYLCNLCKSQAIVGDAQRPHTASTPVDARDGSSSRVMATFGDGRFCSPGAVGRTR